MRDFLVMRIVAAIAAFAADCFHHQQALRGEPAVNFGATFSGTRDPATA